jgi:hypothetical protein
VLNINAYYRAFKMCRLAWVLTDYKYIEEATMRCEECWGYWVKEENRDSHTSVNDWKKSISDAKNSLRKSKIARDY